MPRLTDRLARIHAVQRRGAAALFARSLCIAVATPALVRLPLAQLEAVIEWMAGTPAQEQRNPDDIAATVLDMLQATRPLVRRGCLTRGLTLYCCLRRAGIDVTLNFGMGRVSRGDGFDGHCWIERDGEPYLEPRDPRLEYSLMYSLPSSNRSEPTASGQVSTHATS